MKYLHGDSNINPNAGIAFNQFCNESNEGKFLKDYFKRIVSKMNTESDDEET